MQVMAANEVMRAEVATEFLSLFGLVALAGEWSGIARAASDRLDSDPIFYREKLEVAEFYARRILPRHLALAAGIRGVLTDSSTQIEPSSLHTDGS